MANSPLLRVLASLNQPLSDECSLALKKVLTNDSTWHDVELRSSLLEIIARVTARPFIGPELCHNPAWLDITLEYFPKSNEALKEIRWFPVFVRPLVSRFSPKNRELRRMVASARRLIDPVVKARREAVRTAAEKGEPGPIFQDAMGWGEEQATKLGVDYDATALQLALSLTAMHTSGDLIAQALIDLCHNPSLLEPLREEIREVLVPSAWRNPATLDNVELLDSVLKESQRLKPISIISMGRVARADLVIGDSIRIPMNSVVGVSCHYMWDPVIYENPLTFDGYRFLKRRVCGDPSMERTSAMVATSFDHMGFGHGNYACPGRAFGVNEVKVIILHLLLKYAFKLVEGTPIKPVQWGFETLANPGAKLQVRRRDQELCID